MNRRHALGLLGGVALSSCGKKTPFSVWRGVLFGIPVSMTFPGLSPSEALVFGSNVFHEGQSIENSISLWEEGSELSVLNREGMLKNPSEALRDLLKKAAELHQETNGLFDPTIHSYLTWLKFEYVAGRTPDKKEAERRRQFVDFQRVEISDEKITLPKGFSLDLNSIAQGYITDAVSEAIQGLQDSALINLGEYRVVGPKSFPIEVGAQTINLARALAVSSGSGQRLSATSSENHLLNPNSGESPEPKKIFVVEADEAWLADGLATVIAVGGAIPECYKNVTVHRL